MANEHETDRTISNVRMEIERIRRYADAPLPAPGPPIPEARGMALEDRIARIEAWLRSLRDDLSAPDDAIWDDVRAALDSQGYAGRPIDGQGRMLAEVATTAQYALQVHVADGALAELPQIEVKLEDDYIIRLYVRGENEPRWTT
jgi:hypothetical protein